MKLYRFSPIETKDGLLEAIEHTHFACFELCKKAFGKYLPIAGNIGIFCHYEKEYEFLINLRAQLTYESDNFNKKYYRLFEPIIIPEKGDIPETTYTYLYIRRPDQYRAQVGDADFVIGTEQYDKLKNQPGENGISFRLCLRPGLDMVELSHPDIDALAYISPRNIAEKIKTKIG